MSYRFCVIAIYRMSRRIRITGNICYRQNSCIQSLFVFWQISLWIRFDNWAIRHRLLADSQMNEFVVNRGADASTRKSSVVALRCTFIGAFGRFRCRCVSRRIKLDNISRRIRECMKRAMNGRARTLIGPYYLSSKRNTD